ncbi:tetratricopeptide repeat protein, partial [Sinorhizobium saheli]|nr:tetratricopeptide repeat protein [Sinorhizobium saheli]
MLGSIVKEAKELRLAGSLEKACAKAKIAVAHYPSDVNARMVLAEVLIDLGRPVDAVPHLQVVLSIDPLESRARQKLKLITGTHDYSLDVVETALAGTETRSGVYLRAAEYLNEGLLFADAARIAQAGLDRLTDEERATGLFGGLLFQLAFALEGMQDFDEAITVYDCVPVGQPIRRRAASRQRRLLGSIVKEAKELRLAGSLEKACAKAKIAVAHYPSDVNARMVLAEVLIDLGRPVDAVPHLQVVLSIDPLESRARQKLKLITGTHDYSLDVVETALAGTETRSGVYLRAAEYLNEGLLFADAARIAQAGLDRLTDEERATGLFGGLLFQLAFALEGMQDFDEAITVYDCVPVGQPIRR